MTEGATYLCGCGHEFEEFLGAYGCPNCEGDEGPATLENLVAIRNTRWLTREEFEKEYPAKFIGMDTASGPDRTAVRFQLPRVPLFTRKDVESIECRALEKLIEREFVAAMQAAHPCQSHLSIVSYHYDPHRLTLIATAIKEIYK